MRKVLLTCACSMLLLGLWAVNAAAPNFAGTWVLDKGKSELPPQQAQALKSLTWTITQDGTQITVTPKAEMEAHARLLQLPAIQHRFRMPALIILFLNQLLLL